MTKAELIKILDRYHDDCPVMVGDSTICVIAHDIKKATYTTFGLDNQNVLVLEVI